MTVAAMARALGHKRQSVQRVADALFQEGALTYVDNPQDQRALLAQLTASGKKALARIQQEQVAWANKVASQLSEDELQQLKQSLARLAGILETHSPSNGGNIR